MSYDFSGLTSAQQRVLTFQGWDVGNMYYQPGGRTVKKLIARGLVIAHQRYVAGGFELFRIVLTQEHADMVRHDLCLGEYTGG